MDSILSSVKRGVNGMTDSYTYFDDEMVMHINSVLSILTQLGIGPEEGYSIVGYHETWADFIGPDAKNLEMIKSYVILKVKLLFDHTLGPSTVESIKSLVSELEWRLNVAVDPIPIRKDFQNE